VLRAAGAAFKIHAWTLASEAANQGAHRARRPNLEDPLTAPWI